MTNIKSRRGLALGAAISLVASLFAATPALADENIALAPLKGTSTATFVTEQFSLTAATLNATTDASVGKLKYLVEKTAAAGAISWSADSVLASTNALAAGTSGYSIPASATMSVIVPTASKAVGTEKNIVSIQLNNTTTSSASVDVKVTAFIDNNNNGVVDAGEAQETVTVSFLKWSDVVAVVALAQPIVGDVVTEATGSVTGINTQQLSGTLQIALLHNSTSNTVSFSAIVAGAATTSVPALVAGQTVSAQVRYSTSALAFVLGAKADVKLVRAAIIDTITVSPVKSDNLVASGSSEAKYRVNTPFSLTVATATSSSKVVVPAVKVTVKATVSAALSTVKTVTFGGVAYTTSAGLAAAKVELTTGTDGKAALAVATAGFVNADSISFYVSAENVNSNTYLVTGETPVFTVGNESGDAQLIALGGTANLQYSVKDQWSVLSKRTNQQLSFTVTNPTGMAAKLSAVSVVNGLATAALAATPVTVSGTVQVYANLQEANQDTGLFSNMSATATTVSVVVSSASPAFSTKPLATYSASISYGAAWSWSSIAAGAIKVNAGGAAVTVANADVVFEYDAKTFSGTVVLPTLANGNLPAFKMASRKAGTHTVSFTVGTTVSNVLLIVDAAAGDSGKTMTFDKTSLVAGETTTITGTLVDANGNPVKTSGSDVVLSWTGKGLPFGTGSVQTDADGKFSLNVLVLSTETGASSLTAVYRKSGAATATKDLISATQPLTIGAAAAATDQKLTVGSFKGFVAIYALNYTGSKLSAKVAGKWLVENNLSRFERVVRLTGAAIPIVVDLYIDGKFVRTENIVTK